MGRFYESTAGRFIDDKMFEAPSQLMAQAMLAKDKQIDTYMDKVDAFDPLLKIDALEQDTPRAREIIANYQKRMSSITDAILKNPLSFNKYGRDIKQLGRDIDADFSSGEAYTLNQYKKNVLSEYDAIDKLAEKDGYEPEYKIRERANILANYTGANWDAATGKAKQAPNIRNNYSALNFDDSFLQHMKASGYSMKKDTKGGDGYIYTKKDGVTELTPTELAEATYKFMNADPAFQEAVTRRTQLSQPGFENADLSKAMVYDKDGKLTGFSDDYYGRKIKASTSFAYKDEDHERTIGNDSGYWTRAGWQREDDEKLKESPEITFEETFTVSAGNVDTFGKAINDAKNGLNAVRQESAIVAGQLGIKPGTKAYNDIQAGNFASLAEKVRQGKLTEEKYGQLTSEYRKNNARQKVLSAQFTGFQKFVKEKKGKNIVEGWAKNPDYQEYYKEYTTRNGIETTKDVPLTMSFNKTGLNQATTKEFRKLYGEYFDNASFKITGTAKGGEEVFETADGKKFIYTTDKTKKFFPNPDKNSNQKWIPAKYVESEYRSISQLIEDGVIAKEDIKKTGKKKGSILAEGAEEDDSSDYVTFRNGKSVGLVVDQSSVGLASGQDDEGKLNIGATVTLGNNRRVATISTQYINSPTLQNFISKNQENYEFDRLDNQTNWETLDTMTKVVEAKDSPDGKRHVYHITKGKAYADGVLVGDSEDKKLIKRMVTGY